MDLSPQWNVKCLTYRPRYNISLNKEPSTQWNMIHVGFSECVASIMSGCMNTLGVAFVIIDHYTLSNLEIIRHRIYAITFACINF